MCRLGLHRGEGYRAADGRYIVGRCEACTETFTRRKGYITPPLVEVRLVWLTRTREGEVEYIVVAWRRV